VTHNGRLPRMTDLTKLADVLRGEIARGKAAETALYALENTRERLKARIVEAEASGRRDLAFELKARLMTARPEADVVDRLERGPLNEPGRPA
jgi:hypothetical protein